MMTEKVNKSKKSTSVASEIPSKEENGRALDEYLFHQGTARHAFDFLGAHEEGDQIVFRVWAPHALGVSVVGSFCHDWQIGLPMKRLNEQGIWELWVHTDTVPDGTLYKYRILSPGGEIRLKADPYGRYMEVPPGTATIFLREKDFAWNDSGWLSQRATRAASGRKYPFNIYELHLGSWKHNENGKPLSYRRLADELAPYLKQMGFTHVELMPVMEHPFTGSWGYQVCGYYAPTSRYGTPEEFAAFVDIMHGAGIGVILDWVPAHFPKDAHGLYLFDGEPLYEYEDPTRQENRGWGTCCFDVGRREVKSFLISNAYYWIEKFHVDGLRVDAVASMLYLDYDRDHGGWHPNIYGDRGNLEAISFFQHLNHSINEDHPDVLTIAEESTMWPNVTSFDEYGLGFSYKWNMGWMNDTLRYVKEDPLFRKHNHGLITHIPSYAYDENYVLPISHDEVVHLKKSFLDKMPGDYWQKFAGARVFAAWMMTHPGAKLWFMGAEIGQFAEWSESRQLDWFLLEYDYHAALQHYFAALNNFYLSTPALWDEDPEDPESGFIWSDSALWEESMLVFRRVARDGKEVSVVLNFTPVAREGFPVSVPFSGDYIELFNSDAKEYGGSGVINEGTLTASTIGDKHTLPLRIPPMGCSIITSTQPPTKKTSKATVKRSRPITTAETRPTVKNS
ncbi:MAG: 1,4-alpha-glucan branching protein GlgB [Ruminococcaceae bacterium]|nr:1,4-alpha-glucan branching protein GlgB [Oscillospiraceae bacterium]